MKTKRQNDRNKRQNDSIVGGGISLITPLSTRRGVGGEAVCWAFTSPSQTPFLLSS